MEIVETEEDEGPEVSLNDILETSISNFTAVWRSISNYTHFREEARQLMRAINAFKKGVLYHGENCNRGPRNDRRILEPTLLLINR